MCQLPFHVRQVDTASRTSRDKSSDVAGMGEAMSTSAVTSEITRALSVLHSPDAVVELRAIHKGGRKRIDAGYFDREHREELAEAAAKLNAAGASVYVNLNPIDQQLLARCSNRIQDYAPATATDSNVTERRWLLIDIDPQRPKDTSATAEQVELVMKKAAALHAYLYSRGWPKPVSADSGNGLHFLYRVSLPNDKPSNELIKRCLEALAARFDDEAVKVDRSVHNAARITKLYGSIANKGDNISTAPWRLSKIRTVPEPLEAVPVEKLRELADEVSPAAQPAAMQSGTRASTYGSWGEAEVAAFLVRGGIESVGPEPHDGALRWKLRACPFNSDHGFGEAAVFLRPDGKLGFNCKHSSCSDKHWRELREQVDGPREARQQKTEISRPTEPTHIVPPREATHWPESLAPAAHQGLLGEIASLVAPDTESDPAAILLQTIVAFGALVGRGPHVRIEGDEHHLNLFVLLAGDTSKARKGTSWSRVREIFSPITGWPRVVNGLSSGEGLKYNVRDELSKIERDKKTGESQEVLVDAGVEDKRLLVVESEFAQVLRQGARAGNTLSATIRAAWDTGTLMTLTKNDPVTATGAHISLIGHITIDELRAELTATDSANGFANRFLFMVVKRSKLLPFGGGPLAHDVLQTLGGRIAKAVDRARSRRAVGMTPAARDTWQRVYAALSHGHPGLLGAVTARAEAQCLRLALAYALADEADAIDLRHLLAAIAIWERAEGSARHVFGSALGDRVADEILRGLRAAGPAGVTRTDISALFKRHETADRIGAALDLLSRRGMAECCSQASQAGRPAEVWRVANCERSEKSEISTPPQGVLSHLSLISQSRGQK
jgi:hypothetical protein